MAGTDIFISYESERRKAAEHLAAVLTHYGYSVWFDYQLIKGSDFGLQIGRRIREARALVVLWCARSVDSHWVGEEAALGDRLGTLIPVVIEPCELPVGFQRQDYIDMSAWDGAPRGHQLDPLMDAVEQRIGRPPHLDLKGVRHFEDAWRRYGAPSLKAFALSKPLEEAMGERQMPHNGVVSSAAAAPAVARSAAAAPADHRSCGRLEFLPGRRAQPRLTRHTPLSSYDLCRNSAQSAEIMLARWPPPHHLSMRRCHSSGQMPARVAILRQAALTSRYSADKNRALFAAGGELRRVGTAVSKIQASEVTHF